MVYYMAGLEVVTEVPDNLTVKEYEAMVTEYVREAEKLFQKISGYKEVPLSLLASLNQDGADPAENETILKKLQDHLDLEMEFNASEHELKIIKINALGVTRNAKIVDVLTEKLSDEQFSTLPKALVDKIKMNVFHATQHAKNALDSLRARILQASAVANTYPAAVAGGKKRKTKRKIKRKRTTSVKRSRTCALTGP